jgi:GNAT superfamily N-acetyltransferase
LRGATSVRVGESFPNYLTPGVDLRYAPALSFFRSRGYHLVSEAVNLEVDLGEWQANRQEASPLPEGINIRRATRDDKPAIELLISTHWPPWWGEVSQTLANEPATLFLAWQGENLLGFAAHDANNRSTGWFGPMGTAPEARGKGLGVALLHAALEDMHQSGHQRATIPWVGPVEFYERHAGARLSRTFQRFQKSITARSE